MAKPSTPLVGEDVFWRLVEAARSASNGDLEKELVPGRPGQAARVERWARREKEADMLAGIKHLAWKDIPWLYCIGAVVFFLSWLTEKQLEQEFTRKHDELERLQRHISSDRSIGQLWFSHMLLLGTQEPKNSQATAFASLWYMEFTVSALQSAMAWGNENMAERRKFVEMRQSELESAKAAFRDGQYEKVMSLASHLRTAELQSAGRLASVDQYFNEIEAQRNLRGWLVLVFYVIGAGLVGFAFMRSRLRARDSSEFTTYIDPPHGGPG